MTDVNADSVEVGKGAVHPALVIFLCLGPWLAAWIGSYLLHNAIVSFALYHSLCLTTALCYRIKFGQRAGRGLSANHWILLTTACLAMCAIVYYLTGPLGFLVQPSRVMAGLRGQHLPLSGMGLAILFGYFAAINPLIEEFFWRGTIYSALRNNRIAPLTSSTIAAIFFGSWHFLIVRLFFPTPLAIAITVGIMLIGELLGVFYERTRSLPATSLLHGLAADVPVLIVLWFDVLHRP